jgi:Right handed beta helix region
MPSVGGANVGINTSNAPETRVPVLSTVSSTGAPTMALTANNQALPGLLSITPLQPSGDITGATDWAAITAQLAAIGSVVLAAAPSSAPFWVNQAIQLGSNQTLEGQGIGRTWIKMANQSNLATAAYASNTYTSNSACISILTQNYGANIVNATVKKVSLDGNRANQPPLNGGVTVQDNALNCLHIRGSYPYSVFNVVIDEVECYNAYFHGLVLVEGVTGITVTRNYWHGNGFRGCHAHGKDAPTDVPGGPMVFMQNKCTGNGVSADATWTALLLSGFFVSLSNSHYVLVEGNHVWSEPGHGFECDGLSTGQTNPQATNNTWKGNAVWDCATGFLIGSAATNHIFEGNQVYNINVTGKATGATGYGFSLNGNKINSVGLTNIIIKGNQVNGCIRGLQLVTAGTDGCDGLQVEGNTFTGSLEWGVGSTTPTNKWNRFQFINNLIVGNNTGNSASFGGVQANGWNDFVMSGNIIYNNGDAVTGTVANVNMQTCTFGVIQGNIARGQAASQLTWLIAATCDNITLGINQITRTGGSNAISFTATNSIAVSNNGSPFTSVDAGAINFKANLPGTTGANTATFTNAPTAGNPIDYIPVKTSTGTAGRIAILPF